MKISSAPFRAVLLTLAISPLASAAVLTTIATTGYNRDIVYEAGLAASTTNAITHAFGSRAFFEGGAYATGTGIKRTGNTGTTAGFTTTSGNTVNFDFQAFNGNNALSVGSGGATLGLGGSELYSTLGFVAASSTTTIATYSYTVKYAQGADTTGSFTVSNWGNSNSVTSQIFIQAGGRSQTTRMTTDTPPAVASSAASDRFDQTVNAGSTWNIYLYEVSVDPTRDILDITFSSSTPGDHVIFGVVGAIPEPTSSVLVAGALGLGLLRRKRQS